jgi:esterase/lipase superfamily enzyme
MCSSQLSTFIYFLAYYGTAATFGSAGAAGISCPGEYASYYNNYMAAAAGSFYSSSGVKHFSVVSFAEESFLNWVCP